MTHKERAAAFLDHLYRELPAPKEEIDLLAGLLGEVEREVRARAVAECRRRALEEREKGEVPYSFETQGFIQRAHRRWAAMHLEAAAEAIEGMGETKPCG